MKLFVGVIIVAIIVFIAFSAFGGFNDLEKQQHHDRLQEEINRCNALPSDGSMQSPSVHCSFELMPQVIEFCEKYPNSDVLNGNCADFLDIRDKIENIVSFLYP